MPIPIKVGTGGEMGRRAAVLQTSYKDDYSFNAKLYQFLLGLRRLDLSLEAWSQRTEALLGIFGADPGEAFQFKQRIKGYVSVISNKSR